MKLYDLVSNLFIHIINPHNGKCSKILNTFLVLFSKKILIYRAGIHKMLVRTAKQETMKTTSSEEV